MSVPKDTQSRKTRKPAQAVADEAPRDLDSEAALIAGLLLDPSKLDGMTITAADFFGRENGIIFEAIARLRQEGIAPEVATLATELRATELPDGGTAFAAIGGMASLYRLVTEATRGGTAFSANVVHHARAVRDVASKRRAWRFGLDLARAAVNGKPWSDVHGFMQAGVAEITAAGTPTAPPAFAVLMDSRQLVALDCRPQYLVRGVLVRGQPCVIGGRSKSLKTSIALDLATSLGSGTPFLDQYETERCRVAVWSGESGAATIRETALRIAAARNVALEDCDVRWCFAVPKLGRLDHLDLLRRTITEQAIGVAILDPLYLALLSPETAGQAGNLFSMGAALEPLSTIGTETGATIIVLHHFRKGGTPDPDEPASLEQLSQSGVGEWARQWILLQRRTPYQADGHHELYCRIGGSAGHAALIAIDVDEGILNPDTLDGRGWAVTVRGVQEARQEAKEAAERKKAEQLRQRDEDDCRRMLEALRHFPAGETKRILRDLCGLRGDRLAEALTTLIGEGRAEPCEVSKHGQRHPGYRPTSK